MNSVAHTDAKLDRTGPPTSASPWPGRNAAQPKLIFVVAGLVVAYG